MTRGVRGLDELMAQLKRAPPELAKAIADTNDKSAKRAKRNFRKAVPVHPEAPHLRDTIEIEDGQHELHQRVVTGSDELPYAAALNWGKTNADGTHTPPTHWWTNTYRKEQRAHARALKRACNKAVKDIWNPKP